MNAFLLFIASNLFVACFIACLAFIVGRSGRFATAAHWLWLAVFIKLITPPIVPAHISLPHHWAAPIESAYRSFIPSPASDDKPPVEQRATPMPTRAEATSKSTPSFVVSENIDYQLSVPAVCLIFSACGTCVIIIRGAVRFSRFSKLLKCESVIDEAATASVKRLLTVAEFVPPVRRIAARVSPMLFGIGRNTCIVCPDRLWQTLDQADREAFIAHEVAHFQRRDHWVRWLEWIVTALYWWCPLVYVARQQLERHEEAACDAWAIASLRMSPRTYAEALLNVVDFLSETKVGTPRLASRMHPTDTLEERLRLIMLPQRQKFSHRIHLSVLLTCVPLLLVHPSVVVQAKASITRHDVHNASPEVLRSVQRNESALNTTQANRLQSSDSIDALPPVPQGWWNAPPQRTYANLRLGDRGLSMLAEAGVGLRLQRPNGVAHAFDEESVCALAYVPSSGRLILGNSDGELHLWDTDSSQSVSLIGKHRQAISSVAYHPQGGLVSSCRAGVLSKWDLQSGELLQNISLDERISSVRWAAGGDLLAVVIGNWTDNSGEAQLRVFSGRTFELLQKIAIPGTIAVVQQHEQFGWLAVDWSGQVFSLSSADLMFAIPKADVSGLVLCQELFDSTVRKITN